MIFDTAALRLPLRLEADVCVVGSGAGGSMVAMVAAQAGLRVVVLEAGEFITPASMRQREEQMFARLYWDSAARTTEDRAVRIHQGKGVGGSTLHNLNLCKRVPAAIVHAWRQEHGLTSLPLATWDALYREVEALLTVTEVPRNLWNRHNQLLAEGCQALGWRWGGLSHNRTGCLGSGFCEIGCAFDAKNNAVKVLLPRAIEAGAQVLTGCQAVRIDHAGGGVRGVHAVALRAGTQEAAVGDVWVRAPRVCLAASATGTAALLLRSQVPDPSGVTGSRLHVHPGVVVAGEFDEPVRAWAGIPQTVECTQWLRHETAAAQGLGADPVSSARDAGAADAGRAAAVAGAGDGAHAAASDRLWIVPAFAHPVGAATMLPGHGAEHHTLLRRYEHLGVLTAMLHDRSTGDVAPRGDLGLRIRYWPDAADRRELCNGLWACARLLFAAGAKRVFVPTFPQATAFESVASIGSLRTWDLRPGRLDLTAVHPMSTVPMGDDPARAPVDSSGRHHHVRGLWIADSSLFPSSVGVPPQLSVYALGLHVGRAIVR